VGLSAPYATSHDALDRDTAFVQEVQNAAKALASMLDLIRAGRQEPDASLQQPRPK
jgi:hypothetical protein